MYQTPIELKGLEFLLDITFLIDPSQHVLLKRLKDHIDINYVVPTVKSEKETEQCTEELSDTESQTLDLMLLKFLSSALQLHL